MRQHVAYRFAFEASHFYCLPQLSVEENEQLFGKASCHHGHNYLVEVVYRLSPQAPPATLETLARATRSSIIAALT